MFALFEMKVSPKEIAAVIMEPIQGEGGYVLPRPEFLRAWRRICDEHGILLIFDEIQSGVGRTGKMWASQVYGVEPDIVLTAKGLGSGMPIGAIIARESVMTWLPCEPCGQVITLSRAMMAPMGMPEPRPLAVSTMSGSTP